MANEFLKLTATSIFVVPVLKLSLKDLWKHGFENAYMKDEIKNMDYKNAVYLLFRPMNITAFNEFVEAERERKYLIDEYDYPDGWTMLVYKFHEQWQEDIDIIMTGKFSEVSEPYKREIPRKTNNSQGTLVTTLPHHIFGKSQYLKSFWKKLYDLDLTDLDEHWQFYPERELFNEETKSKLI